MFIKAIGITINWGDSTAGGGCPTGEMFEFLVKIGTFVMFCANQGFYCTSFHFTLDFVLNLII